MSERLWNVCSFTWTVLTSFLKLVEYFELIIQRRHSLMVSYIIDNLCWDYRIEMNIFQTHFCENPFTILAKIAYESGKISTFHNTKAISEKWANWHLQTILEMKENGMFAKKFTRKFFSLYRANFTIFANQLIWFSYIFDLPNIKTRSQHWSFYVNPNFGFIFDGIVSAFCTLVFTFLLSFLLSIYAYAQ